MDIPKDIKKLLENENLCAMATASDNKPYLSLMNFTYMEAENKIILSSRKNSRKYTNIQNNNNISLLIASSPNEQSATLLGTALTIDTEDEMNYRKKHLKNIKMPQFAEGDNIGLIVFSIEKIIISNNQDQVKYIDEVSH